MLIGAGCVAVVETSAVTLGEYGQAPRFREAVSPGAITIRDSTCPAIHAGLQASEKGVPFIPLRGILGWDLQAHRDDWRVIDNPFGERRPDPAPARDPAGRRAVPRGRCRSRRQRLDRRPARAHDDGPRGAPTLVTVEAIADDDLLADDRTAAGTIPALYVTAIAEAREGAWPVGLAAATRRRRTPAAATRSWPGPRRASPSYLDEHVLGPGT